MATLTTAQKNVLENRLDMIRASLEQACKDTSALLRDAKKMGDDEFKRCFLGEIESYLLPGLMSFIDDENQPGAINSLEQTIEDHSPTGTSTVSAGALQQRAASRT